jgi:hypothetical protein
MIEAPIEPGEGAPSLRSRRFLWIACALVGVLVVAYLGNGFYHLCLADGGAGDLRRRWVEQSYFVAGVDPNEASTRSPDSRSKRGSLDGDILARLSAEVGPLAATAYPPSSYAIGMLFVPTLPYWMTRSYFSLLNVAALAFAALWAYRRGAAFGKAQGMLLGLGALAIFANAITLRHGQYPVVVNALLLGMLLSEEKGREWISGVLLGLAALKPNVALLFFLVPLVRGNVRGVVAAGGLVAATAFAGAAYVGSNPIVMTLTGLKQPHDWSGHLGLLEPLTLTGMSPEHVSVVGLGLGLLTAFAIMLRHRNLPVLELMAVAATIGQLCTYHRRYDQVNLLFPLVALGLLAFRRPGRTTWLAFALFGASLWLPHRDRYLTFYPVALLQYLAWIFGLVVMLTHREGSPAKVLHAA